MRDEEMYGSDYRVPVEVMEYEYRSSRQKLSCYKAIVIAVISVFSILALFQSFNTIIDNGITQILEILSDAIVALCVFYIIITIVSNIARGGYLSNRISESLYKDNSIFHATCNVAESKRNEELYNLKKWKYEMVTLSLMFSFLSYLVIIYYYPEQVLSALMPFVAIASVSLLGILIFYIAAKYFIYSACNYEKILCAIDDKNLDGLPTQKILDSKMQHAMKILFSFKIAFIVIIGLTALLLIIKNFLLDIDKGITELILQGFSVSVSILGIIALAFLGRKIILISGYANKITEILSNSKEEGCSIDVKAIDVQSDKEKKKLITARIVLLVFVAIGFILSIAVAILIKIDNYENGKIGEHLVITILTLLIKYSMSALGVFVIASGALYISKTAKNTSKSVRYLANNIEDAKGSGGYFDSAYRSATLSLTTVKVVAAVILGIKAMVYFFSIFLHGRFFEIFSLLSLTADDFINLILVFIIANVAENLMCTAFNMKRIESTIKLIKKVDTSEIVNDGENNEE